MWIIFVLIEFLEIKTKIPVEENLKCEFVHPTKILVIKSSKYFIAKSCLFVFSFH